MKKTLIVVLLLAFGVAGGYAQPGSGQGPQTGKTTQLKTKIQERKRLHKRDSTGVYHEQNVKTREARQKANRGSQGKGKGLGKGRGKGKGQGQGQGQGGQK